MIDFDSTMDDENYVGLPLTYEPLSVHTLKKRFKSDGLQLRNWRDDNAALLSALLLKNIP